MWYHVCVVFISMALLLTSCAAPSARNCAEGFDKSSLRVTMTKGACFGQCPIYSATVYGDGSVDYTGERFVERMGTYAGSIPADDLCAIITEIERNKAMVADRSFLEEVPDAPLTTITIVMRGRTVTVKWNLVTPEMFRSLHSLMVKATHENPTLTKVGG